MIFCMYMSTSAFKALCAVDCADQLHKSHQQTTDGLPFMQASYLRTESFLPIVERLKQHSFAKMKGYLEVSFRKYYTSSSVEFGKHLSLAHQAFSCLILCLNGRNRACKQRRAATASLT
jgi:hypothetical protein